MRAGGITRKCCRGSLNLAQSSPHNVVKRNVDSPVSPWAARVSWGVGIGALGSGDLPGSLDISLGLVAHICLIPADQLHSQLVELLEVVRGVRGSDGLPSQPGHILSAAQDR